MTDVESTCECGMVFASEEARDAHQEREHRQTGRPIPDGGTERSDTERCPNCGVPSDTDFRGGYLCENGNCRASAFEARDVGTGTKRGDSA